MKPVEIIGISIFGALCLGALCLALRQGARTQERMAAYSIARGGIVLGKREGAALGARLEEMTPGWSWGISPVLQLHPPPQSAYLFGFQTSRRSGASGTSIGFACFAERADGKPGPAVEIDRRIPVLHRLVEDRVETGSEEFRREFIVTCRDAAVAHAVVNPEVQRILLHHAAGAGWNAGVVLGPRGVLVRSQWARGESEWDYITTMTLQLRAALGQTGPT